MILSKLKQTLLGATIIFSSIAMQLHAQSSTPRRITVDPSSTTNSGTSFSTIKMAVDSSRDRDTILVKEGTYKEKIIVGGSKRLVFGSEFLLDGNKTHISNTIISGNGVTQNNTNDVLFGAFGNTYDSTYFRFVGFTIDSAAKYGMEVRGGLVTDCIFKNSGSATTVPFYFHGTYLRNITVFNNIGTAIIAFNGVGSQNTNAPYAVIENGLFYNNKGVSQNQNNERGPYGGNLGGVIWFNQDVKAKLLNSIFYNNSGDHVLVIGGGNVYDEVDVYNNVFYKNKTRTAFFRTWEGDFGRNNLTTRWYNNIIDNEFTQATQPNTSEFAWGGGSDVKPSRFFFKNNIFGKALSVSNQTGFSSRFTFDYDTASHLISAVKFKDTARLDFDLLATSPGIGAGINNLVPTKDFKGENRPLPAGTRVDIGAIESNLAYPTPEIISLQNAVIDSKRAIKLNYSVFNNPRPDSVIIYRNTSVDTSDILLTPIDSVFFDPNAQSIYTDTSALVGNTSYNYIIKTFYESALLNSAGSAKVSLTTPSVASIVSVPTNLTVTPSGRSNLTLNWVSVNKVASSTATTTYIDIYRGETVSSITKLASIRDTADTYDDITTIPSTKYYYYLINRDSVNNVISDTSINVSGTTGSLSNSITIYVKASASAGGNGSESTPYNSLKLAFEKAKQGDKVVALEGTYNEKFTITPGVIFGSKYLVDNTDTGAIRKTILNAAGINGNMIAFNSNNSNGRWTRTQIVGLHFTGAAGSGKQLFEFNNWQMPVTIDRALFTKNGPKVLTYVDGRNPDQDIVYARINDSLILQNSTFENNYGRLEIGGRDNLIQNNTFANNNLDYVRPQGHWIGYSVITGWVNGKTTIANNIFLKNGTTWNDLNQVSVLRINGNDSIFYTNNTFVGNNVPVIKFDNNVPASYYTNNIFHKNTTNFYVGSSVSAKFIFKNNFFNSDPKIDKYLSNLDADFSNNLVALDLTFSDTVKLILDPSSNLINSGTSVFGKANTLSVPVKDIYGNARPLPAGSNVDIGAVESPFAFPSPLLTTADGADKSVSLKWRKPTNGTINGYEIFRSNSTIPNNTSAAATIIIDSADLLNYKDTALTNLTSYFYRLRAFSGTTTKIYSGLSNELSVQPNVPPVGVDTVSAYAGARNIALKWVDTAGKRKYNIYRGTSTTNLEKIASAVDTTYYVDKTSTAHTKFFYAVSVVDNVGASSTLSKIANATASNIWTLDTAGKATNNGSAFLPMKSLQFVIDNGLPGDTILLNNGIYYENIELIRKQFTIMAKNKGKAILKPTTADASSKPIIRIQDQYDWNLSSYPSNRNTFIGLVIAESQMTQWTSNLAPAAVDVNFNSNPLFEACTFINNTSQFVFNTNQSSAEIRNSLILNNTTQNGVFNLQGGGDDSTRPKTRVLRIVNSLIANNSYLSRAWGAERGAVIFNSIIYENGYDANFNDKLYRVVGSIVDNPKLLAQSASNKLVEPQFINPSNSDYNLSSFSPALGMAESRFIIPGGQLNDTLFAINYDYNNQARPNPTGTAGDVGPFESKFSLAAPQITRIQRAAKTITLTWEKPESTTSYTSIKVYRDTTKASLDTIAPLSINVDLARNTFTDELPNDKVYYYALKATLGTGASEIKTGLSNVKSVLDTIFIPALNFGMDTASIKIKSGSRNGGHVSSLMHLVNLGTDVTPGLPKLIFYSQEFKTVDSTGTANESDYLNVLNINRITGSSNITFSLNSRPLLNKGKADYLQLLSASNVNADDDFDFVAYFRKAGNMNDKTQIAYLVNDKNLNFRIDTTNVPKQFFNTNAGNQWNQTTNLTYKWDQPTFKLNEWAMNAGQNIESTVEYMDGNFDGKEEMITTLQQVKWEPNASINLTNTNIVEISASIKLVKFMDINNDGVPDIFGTTTWPGGVGLGQTNGNPLVAFVSNKKAGKFFMHHTGINVDWGANLSFNDFRNERKVQILTRTNGGNYKV